MVCGSYCGWQAATIAARNARILLPGILTEDSYLTKRKTGDLRQLEKPYISGITFSGGDPMHPVNRADVRELMSEIREKYPTKTIWMYTGGQLGRLCDLPVMQYVDVVVDGEFHVEEKDVKLLWKGSKNQRVIDVKKTLASDHRRVPVLHCGDYA